MYKGKKTCKILKDIRKQIAEANDIEYIVEECKYQGDCLGTCPKCEADVRYLEAQLNQRRMLGKAVVLAGISAGVISITSCGSDGLQIPLGGDIRVVPDTAEVVDTASSCNDNIMGKAPKVHPRDSENMRVDIGVQVKK